MEFNTFWKISTFSMIATLLVAVLSLIGIPFTGFYPAIFFFILIAILPIGMRSYAKKIEQSKFNNRKRFFALSIFNIFLILVILWMAFVIVHDRILHDCC